MSSSFLFALLTLIGTEGGREKRRGKEKKKKRKRRILGRRELVEEENEISVGERGEMRGRSRCLLFSLSHLFLSVFGIDGEYGIGNKIAEDGGWILLCARL